MNLTSTEEAGDDGWSYRHYLADVGQLTGYELGIWPAFMMSEFLPKVIDDFLGVPIDHIFIRFSVRIDKSTLISEKVMWDLVIDTLPDCEKHIKLYIAEISKLFAARVDLPWTSTLGQLGAYSIQSYFDRAMSRDKFRSLNLSMFDCYLTHLELCDMDHEVHQQEYIKEIIRILVYRDSRRLHEWIWFRYYNGQYGGIDEELQVPALMIGGVLKFVIDKLIEQPQFREPSQELSREPFLNICAVAYGLDLLRIYQVMEYVEHQLTKQGKYFAEDAYLMPAPSSIRAYKLFGAIRDVVPRYEIDTGFHKLDKKERKWLKCECLEFNQPLGARP